jgi:hypothetical protein
MDQWLITVLTFAGSVLASGGFWAFMQRRTDSKDSKTKLLMGIAHDRIVYLGMLYIDRGEITQDEFENLDTYLYAPYKELGGNGTGTKIMDEVYKLPIIRTIPKKKEGA